MFYTSAYLYRITAYLLRGVGDADQSLAPVAVQPAVDTGCGEVDGRLEMGVVTGNRVETARGWGVCTWQRLIRHYTFHSNPSIVFCSVRLYPFQVSLAFAARFKLCIVSFV